MSEKVGKYGHEGHYIMVNPAVPEDECIVYYYRNPDTKTWGFGFNIADGCGFIPESDIAEGSTIAPAAVVAAIYGSFDIQLSSAKLEEMVTEVVDTVLFQMKNMENNAENRATCCRRVRSALVAKKELPEITDVTIFCDGRNNHPMMILHNDWAIHVTYRYYGRPFIIGRQFTQQTSRRSNAE